MPICIREITSVRNRCKCRAYYGKCKDNGTRVYRIYVLLFLYHNDARTQPNSEQIKPAQRS